LETFVDKVFHLQSQAIDLSVTGLL